MNSNKQLRLVFVSHNLVRGDGQGRLNLEIVRYALAAGHRVHLIAADIDPQLISDGASCDYIRVPRRPVLARVIMFANLADRALDRSLEKLQADLVIANGHVMNRQHDLNMCQFVHTAWLNTRRKDDDRSWVDRVYQQLYTRYNARLEQKIYRSVRHIVTPSRQTADDLKKLGISGEKITIIGNGVDTDDFKPGPSNRLELGLPNGVQVVLFAGDLRTNRKGIKFVIQALERVPNVHLVVVGRSSGSPFIEYANKLRVGKRVTFLGFRQDMANVMRACDLFVFPSRYEPYGMVVVEALACGLPTITTAITGASELINERCGTVLEDPSDIPALASAIEHWLKPRSCPGSVAGHCLEAVRGRAWPDVASAYMSLIEKIASDPCTPPAVSNRTGRPPA